MPIRKAERGVPRPDFRERARIRLARPGVKKRERPAKRARGHGDRGHGIGTRLLFVLSRLPGNLHDPGSK